MTMKRFLPVAVLLATFAVVLAEEDYSQEWGDFSFPDFWAPPRHSAPWGGGGSWSGRRTAPVRRPTPPARRRVDEDWGWDGQASSREETDGACGRTAELNRVVGGEEAVLGQFPWQAALLYRRGSGPESVQCGGALVHPRYVVTAAHCLHTAVTRDWRLTKIRLGEWDRQTAKDCDDKRCAPPPLDFSPDATILHPSFSPATPGGGGGGSRNEGDIALVRLDRPAPYTDFVRPVCLPWDDPDAAGDLRSQILLVAGWGRTETAEGSDRLLFARVPAVSLADCSRRLRVALSRTQLCAGADGRDACKGDSGGPLLRVARSPDGRDSFFQLVGIVSFGPDNCGSPNLPGAYTRVAAFLPWLRENMRP